MSPCKKIFGQKKNIYFIYFSYYDLLTPFTTQACKFFEVGWHFRGAVRHYYLHGTVTRCLVKFVKRRLLSWCGLVGVGGPVTTLKHWSCFSQCPPPPALTVSAMCRPWVWYLCQTILGAPAPHRLAQAMTICSRNKHAESGTQSTGGECRIERERDEEKGGRERAE